MCVYTYRLQLATFRSMAELPDMDKHLLGVLSQLPGMSIAAAPPPRSIQSLIRICGEKKHPFSETDINLTRITLYQ